MRRLAITMALIALVLLLALVIQGIYVCRSEYQDMRRTMSSVTSTRMDCQHTPP